MWVCRLREEYRDTKEKPWEGEAGGGACVLYLNFTSEPYTHAHVPTLTHTHTHKHAHAHVININVCLAYSKAKTEI